MTAWLCFGFCCGSAFRFFWRRRIGAMADHRHHGEGEHHQGNVAMPPMPGSALVVIEPELVFRGLKTVLDRPSMTFDRHQRFDGCSRWTPGGEEGEIAIGDMTTDPADRASTDLDLRSKILRPRDRPIRDSTNHAAAVLWFRPLPTGVSSRTGAASGRSPRPCRRRIAACPRIETHERC